MESDKSAITIYHDSSHYTIASRRHFQYRNEATSLFTHIYLFVGDGSDTGKASDVSPPMIRSINERQRNILIRSKFKLKKIWPEGGLQVTEPSCSSPEQSRNGTVPSCIGSVQSYIVTETSHIGPE